MVDEERWKEINEYIKKIRMDKFTEKDKSILNAETLDWIVQMSAFTIYHKNYISDKDEIKEIIIRDIKNSLKEDFCNIKQLKDEEIQKICQVVYPYVIESASESKKQFPELEEEEELEI